MLDDLSAILEQFQTYRNISVTSLVKDVLSETPSRLYREHLSQRMSDFTMAEKNEYCQALLSHPKKDSSTGIVLQALAHEKGFNTAINIELAMTLNQDAMSMGNAMAFNNYAALLRKKGEYAQANLYFQLAADKGDAAGSLNLGIFYYKKEYNHNDISKALALFERVKEDSLSMGYDFWGDYYLAQNNIPQAMAHLKKGLSKGNERCLAPLGNLYRNHFHDLAAARRCFAIGALYNDYYLTLLINASTVTVANDLASINAAHRQDPHYQQLLANIENPFSVKFYIALMCKSSSMLQQLLSKDFNLLFALLQRETTAYFKDNRWLYDFFLQLLQDFNVPQKHKDYLYAQLAAVDELNQYTPVDKDNTGIHISLSFGGTLHEHIKRISSDAVLPPNLAFMVGSYYYQNSLSQPDAFKRLMQKKALHFLTPLKTNNTCAYYMIWSMLDNKETLNNMTPTSEKFSALTLKHNEETITKWFKLITRMIKEFNKPRFSYAGQQPCDSHPYNHWLLNEIPVLQKLIILYALFKDPTKTLLSYQIAVPILYNDMNNWKKQSKQLILDRIHMLTTIEPAQLDAQVKEIHQLASKRASIETVSDLVFKQPKLSKQSAP